MKAAIQVMGEVMQDDFAWRPDLDSQEGSSLGGSNGQPALFSEILPGLFQGGTEDRGGFPAGAGVSSQFAAVVTLFAWAAPCDWGVEELRYSIPDATSDRVEMSRVVRAARWAYERWQSGDRVLIRCQVGLNRSGLVTALVLMLAGSTAGEAIAGIRVKRSSGALNNASFVRWLRRDAAKALAVPGLAA